MSRRPRTGLVGQIRADHSGTVWAEEARLDAMPVRPEPDPVEETPTPAPKQPKPGRGRAIVVERKPAGSVVLSSDDADRVVRALKAEQGRTTDQAQIARLMRERHVIQQQRNQP